MSESPNNPDSALEAARAQARQARSRGHQRGPLDPERIGPYNIVARIGSGGMGIVYLAEHAEDGHVAAVKVLKP
ncbi:MAG: serine/threonine protein kinase, partial [Planctomycetota bacterium]